jgi:hypothetical protein
VTPGSIVGRDRSGALEPSPLSVSRDAAAPPLPSSASRAGLLLGMLGAALTGRLTPRERGRRLRRFFEARGGLWVKLARSNPAPRHIRQAFCAELSHRPRIGLPSRTSASW